MDAAGFKRDIIPHYRRMFAVALRVIGDSDGAADAVQEAMARLWERRDALDEVDCAGAYCITVTRRICIDRLRQEAACPSTPLRADTVPAETAPEASTAIERDEDARLLAELMSRLPQAQQRVLRLSAIGGLGNDEIAQITGETPANVRQLLCRARRRLRELFITANK